MKKLCVGVLFAMALLLAKTASASPCGLCQAYYPCSWACEHCYPGMGGPGYWTVDGYCWGDEVQGTCGDIGQCSGGQPGAFENEQTAVEPSVDLKQALGLCQS